MLEELQKIIDDFVWKMEGINDKRLEASCKDAHFAMQELKLFNELRQNLLVMEKIGLSKEIKSLTDGRDSIASSIEDLRYIVEEANDGIPEDK